MEYLNIFIRSVFIENMIFAYFLGTPTPEKCEQRGRSEGVRTDGRARLGRNVWEP